MKGITNSLMLYIYIYRGTFYLDVTFLRNHFPVSFFFRSLPLYIWSNQKTPFLHSWSRIVKQIEQITKHIPVTRLIFYLIALFFSLYTYKKIFFFKLICSIVIKKKRLHFSKLFFFFCFCHYYFILFFK